MLPPPEWVTLNSNGSVIPESGYATAGALIIDHTRYCIAMFVINLGICSITLAELGGTVEGFQLAWELGYHQVNVQLERRCAVQIL
ncbi:unnamed protein product [Linum trigynum]|uniref:RNase H type-1 domain-containing protein n=1 Tax=Linum trigynum TaxID=586398 RepID=A0AAV2DDR6_9ROSI